MGFQRLGSLDEVALDSVVEMKIGDRQLAVCRVNGELHVLEGICPHVGGPLGHGAPHGTTLVCPWHGWEFDCTSGYAPGTGTHRVPKIPTKLEGDDILVDLG
jgi:nitrite reductase/ring-hydroxylating ferredoxin subunit